MFAKAKAHSNIALVKYWGKRDEVLNLPAVGSISVTLEEMESVSSVHFRKDLSKDTLILNDAPALADQSERVSRFLDIIRKEAELDARAEVVSRNNFPTGAGLASSASAFASLALAASRAAGLNYEPNRLSEVARLGSGSAARSIFGGFVEMKVGERADGSDAVAFQIADQNYWDLRIIIAITSEEKKKVGSTEGMNRTAASSPFYGQWVYSSQKDLEDLRSAIFSRNFHTLGKISEFSCLKMHAVAMSAQPGIIYWNKITVDCIKLIYKLREEGLSVYFTIDAGPQLKAICLARDAESVQAELKKVAGVKKVMITSPGAGAEILESPA